MSATDQRCPTTPRLVSRPGEVLVTGKRGGMGRLQSVLPPDWQIGDPVPWHCDPKRRAVTTSEPRPARAKPVLVANPVPAAAPPVSEASAQADNPLAQWQALRGRGDAPRISQASVGMRRAEPALRDWLNTTQESGGAVRP